jgi:hypothetical protein
MERLDTYVDVDLFSKTVISVVSDKHHRHPVITGVTRNLFRATATYNIHEFFSPVASLKGQVNTCRTRQKEDMVCLEKKEMRLFICGSYATLQTTQYSQSQLL